MRFYIIISLLFPFTGARIILPVRDEEKGLEVAKSIQQSTKNQNVVVHRCDLSSLASIRAFVDEIIAYEARLDILVTCAGMRVFSDPLLIIKPFLSQIYFSLSLSDIFFIDSISSSPMSIIRSLVYHYHHHHCRQQHQH